jgi:hypothetical protein
MTRILIGISAALVITIGFLGWNINLLKTDNDFLTTNNTELEISLALMKKNYIQLEVSKDAEIKLLINRFREKESKIYALQERINELQNIQDDTGCLELLIPDDVVRLLNPRESDNNTDSSTNPTSRTFINGMFQTSI